MCIRDSTGTNQIICFINIILAFCSINYSCVSWDKIMSNPLFLSPCLLYTSHIHLIFSIHNKKQPAKSQKFHQLLSITIIAVSYTHLDVYKRQGSHSTVTVEIISLSLQCQPFRLHESGRWIKISFLILWISEDVYKRQTLESMKASSNPPPPEARFSRMASI